MDIGNPWGHLGLYLEVTAHGPFHMDILYPPLLPCIDISITGEAAESPEILILEIGAVAPAEYFERNEILSTCLDIFRNVETGFELAVLTISDLFSVDPDTDIGGSRTDTQADLLALPCIRYREGTAVLPNMIVLSRDDGRIVGVMASP